MGDGATGGSLHEGPHWRVRAAIAAATGVGLTGLGAAAVFGPLMTVPTAVAVAGAVAVPIAGPAARRLRAAVAGAAGIVSLAGTAGVVLTGGAYGTNDRAVTLWALPETAALLFLTLLTVRVSRPRSAVVAAALSGIAVPCWLLRFGEDAVTPAMLGGLAAWAAVSLLAVTAGLYLRALDERRGRAVADARRAQREQLAADLHDFVAHDISGMLAQAQAGQILAERDPAAAQAAFRRIERSGMAALASMDQSVHMLHDPACDGADRRMSPPTLAGLPELVSRFLATGQTAGRLDLDPDLEAEQLPREVTTTGYRLVVEALTNIRRHAPHAGRVTVTVRRTTPTPGLEIIVADDGGARPPATPEHPGRQGGLGLAGLTDRVEALSGTLTAGPADPTGWRVAAFLPLPNHRGPRHG